MLSRLTPRERLILAVACAVGDLILVAAGLIFWRYKAAPDAQILLALAVLYGLMAVALVHSLLRHRA